MEQGTEPAVGPGEAIALTIEHLRDRLRREEVGEEECLDRAREHVREANPGEVVASVELMAGSHWEAIGADPELCGRLRERVGELLASPDLCERTAQEAARRRRAYG